MLSLEQQSVLLELAKNTLNNFVKTGDVPEFWTDDESLKERLGAFVTIYKKGSLRGCVGQLIPSEKRLWEVVRDLAVAASCEDPRFNPITKRELKDLVCEISILSQPKKIDSWREVVVGEHGVIIQSGAKAGALLPQVAIRNNWGLDDFMARLCEDKAGLEADAYKKTGQIDLFIFTAQVF
jgi:AmmeMemoRadiSam system protein A